MVNSENVIHFMEEIAHKELLQKPQYIADCWKDIVCILLPSFPDSISSPLPQGSHEIATRMRTSVLIALRHQ